MRGADRTVNFPVEPPLGVLDPAHQVLGHITHILRLREVVTQPCLAEIGPKLRPLGRLVSNG